MSCCFERAGTCWEWRFGSGVLGVVFLLVVVCLEDGFCYGTGHGAEVDWEISKLPPDQARCRRKYAPASKISISDSSQLTVTA
jgi:hypothetical protein